MLTSAPAWRELTWAFHTMRQAPVSVREALWNWGRSSSSMRLSPLGHYPPPCSTNASSWPMTEQATAFWRPDWGKARLLHGRSYTPSGFFTIVVGDAHHAITVEPCVVVLSRRAARGTAQPNHDYTHFLTRESERARLRNEKIQAS